MGGKRTHLRYTFVMAAFACRLTLIGLLMLPSTATAGSRSSIDWIAISQRPQDVICAGVCPNADVTVWRDGRVLVVRHHSGRPDDVEHFRVSQDEAARFRSILLPYRPTSHQTDPDACKVDPQQGGAGVLKAPQIEVRWCDDAGPARLRFITNNSVEAVRQALWSVHLYIDGWRRD